MSPSAHVSLLYIFYNTYGLVILSAWHVETVFDTLIQVFQYNYLGICVDGNEDGDHLDSCCMAWGNGGFNSYSYPKSHLIFHLVDTEKYIVLVSGYGNSEEGFKLLDECNHYSYGPMSPPNNPSYGPMRNLNRNHLLYGPVSNPNTN